MEDNNNYKIKDKSKRILLGVISVLLVIVLGACVWFAMSLAGKERALEAEREAREQAELNLDQALMDRDFDELNREFSSLENQRVSIMDDSVKRELTEKYEAAKLKVEKLQQELQNQKKKSAAEIKKLKDEISTLRALLRHYVEEINRLNQENQELRTENETIKKENTRLSSQVQETSRKNEVLSERMTLAEKLNVTGVNLTALNKKGKNEKKVSKAKQLMVTFTIPQNNSTPVGEKTIYMRLISPSGQLLGSAGTFSFEGGSVECSAKKTVEYAGEEIANIHIYWDVNTALSPGDYTVELFADNYRLARRSFSLK
ncbi:MAG: hypothetical protein NC241_00495 [Bacteroides sp.]|nr:hypothetical protein [Bacteroides sp.]MCM1457110.1 hypothetical protein [Lachnoclostridium sp.]